MDWVSLLNHAGADPQALLCIAEMANMSVAVHGDKLVIRGPRSAVAIANRLLDHKHEVMGALTNSAADSGDVSDVAPIKDASDTDVNDIRDESGFPIAENEHLIDPSTVTPCPCCGALVKWRSAIGQMRCQDCDPPTFATQLLKRVEKIRRRQGIKSDRRHVEGSEPHCRRCFSTHFVDTKVHGGRSIRRDCAQCGLTAGFPMWWGKVDDRFGAS